MLEALDQPDCAYYFKEGMTGDYINGVDWEKAESDPEDCAVYFARDGETIDYDGQYWSELERIQRQEALRI